MRKIIMTRIIIKQSIRLTISISILFLLSVGTSYSTEPKGVQPIRFNHKKHFNRDIECLFCHETAEESQYAGRPNRGICESCHRKKAQTNSKEEEILRTYIKKQIPIKWIRTVKTRYNIYFSHARHVTLGEIACLSCHPYIKDLTHPPDKNTHTITMNFCITCHKQKSASTDCISCHR